MKCSVRLLTNEKRARFFRFLGKKTKPDQKNTIEEPPNSWIDVSVLHKICRFTDFEVVKFSQQLTTLVDHFSEMIATANAAVV